ncbi:MAG: SDR family oxidoreductase [Planctomycetaceae bacterium]|nr:SDR family oxidoreductase [Planctomycetaceae bacterium]MCA9078953.1 SDR family oxidoreductase [Planctomycetaceae bacterium]
MPTVQELFDLTGKTALITGASGYLGQALSAALAEAGARVIVSSREQEKANETAAALGGVEQGRHLGIAMDQLKEDSIEQGFAAAVEQAGGIDILVNNGNFPVGEDWTTVSGEQFNRQLSNATGYFLLAREFRNHLVESGRSGSVIMLGSMYGVVGSYPEAYAGVTTASPVAYHALKGGIVHLTRHLAVYWAQDNVRVNCLSPGPFPSEKAPQAMVERLKQKSPMGRMGRPDELKGAIVFLASEASSYVTGQNLLVDGGWTAW